MRRTGRTSSGKWIADSTDAALTDPGAHRMPCDASIVDFFQAAEGEARWFVAADERSYTRETVAIARHGGHPWEQHESLTEATVEIAKLASVDSGGVTAVFEKLTESIDAREVERVALDRSDMTDMPLASGTDRFGIDLDQL